MQSKPRFANTNELDRLAQRFQRIANMLTRLARVAGDYPILLKLGTLGGMHLIQIEKACNRVCGIAAAQVAEQDIEIGRSLIA